MAFLLPVFTAIGSTIGSVLGSTAVVGTTAAGTASGFSLGTALTLGSTLLGAVGAIQQGQAANQAAKAQQQAAEYNAQVQEAQAKVAQDQGAAKATEISMRTRQRLAASRAAGLESGLELDGSVSDVLDTVNKQGALDQLTALYDSNLRAQGLRQSAAASRAEGENAILGGKAKATAAYIGAGTSLLSGFSKLYQG